MHAINVRGLRRRTATKVAVVAVTVGVGATAAAAQGGSPPAPTPTPAGVSASRGLDFAVDRAGTLSWDHPYVPVAAGGAKRPVAKRPVAKPAVKRVAAKRHIAPARASRSAARLPLDPRGIARVLVAKRGWSGQQFSCLDSLWRKESNWRVYADNPSSSAYGIPQALPGAKMSSAGADWRTNPATQIRWGLGYIAERYGTPCAAWAFSRAHNYY